METKRKFSELRAGDTDQSLGKVIKEVILSGDTHLVYLDTDGVIQWTTTSEHDQFGNDFGKIQGQISTWEMLSNRLFAKDDAYDYKCLLAEGYATMLDEGNDASAQGLVDKAAAMITVDGTEVLKRQYLLSGFWMAAAIGLVLVFSVFIVGGREPINHFRNVFDIFVSGLLGGIGAFASMMIRSKKYIPDIHVSKLAPRFDGLMRIVYGVLAGVLIALGVKSDIVFGFVKTGVGVNIFILAFLAAIGGASEVILPNIIKQVEDKA